MRTVSLNPADGSHNLWRPKDEQVAHLTGLELFGLQLLRSSPHTISSMLSFRSL